MEYEDEIVRQVQDDYNRLRLARRPLELQWRLNMNFISGNQFCEISPSGEIDDYGKQYFWQSREVFNHIAPIMETRLAKLSRVKAHASVRPFSSDDNDIKTAQLSTQILRAVTEDNNLMSLVNQANTWSEVCGSAFYKVMWDKDLGAQLGKNSKGEMINEGDVAIEVCPPYEIFPDDLAATSIEDCKYIIHARALDKAEVRDAYGVDAEGANVEIFSIDAAENGGGLGYSATSIKVGAQVAEDKVVVLEKYEQPTSEFPHGRLIIVAGGKLVYYGNLPYNIGKDNKVALPFARQIAIDSVANFYGISVIERIIPIQRAYNAIKNRKHEFLSRIAMGVLAVEDGSIDTESLESEGLSPGKILVYRQGSAPPKMLDMGNVPNDFTMEEERLRQEFMQISGVSEMMRYSALPSNVTSGTAIGMLQEQDETRIITTAEHIRQAIKNIGQMLLRLYKQFAVNSRVKRLAGENGGFRAVCFKGSDLASDDLVFDTDNELTETPSNRRGMVYELIKLGVLQDDSGRIDPRMRSKIMEMLGFGNWESARDIDDCHRERAQKENYELQDKQLKAMQYDNHEIHIAEHTKAIIAVADDIAQAEKLDAHIKEHEIMMAMSATNMQAAALQNAEK